jgi:hypothetical protein
MRWTGFEFKRIILFFWDDIIFNLGGFECTGIISAVSVGTLFCLKTNLYITVEGKKTL